MLEGMTEKGHKKSQARKNGSEMDEYDRNMSVHVLRDEPNPSRGSANACRWRHQSSIMQGTVHPDIREHHDSRKYGLYLDRFPSDPRNASRSAMWIMHSIKE